VTEWATQRQRSETIPDGRPRKCPSARAIARMITLRPRRLTREEATTLAQIEDGVPRLAEAAALVDEFINAFTPLGTKRAGISSPTWRDSKIHAVYIPQ